MKMMLLLSFVSFSALAQFPKMPESFADVKDLSKQVMDSCKDDKSKIKGCESYTEFAPLKTCLLENKEKLSAKCKTSLMLVK